MKAAVFYDREDIRYEERPIPQIGENEVLLKMKVCGVCGTDIHKVVDRTVPPNTVLGHEVAGKLYKLVKMLHNLKKEIVFLLPIMYHASPVIIVIEEITVYVLSLKQQI